MENNNIFIDEVATKRFHKALEQVEDIADILSLLSMQIESEEDYN